MNGGQIEALLKRDPVTRKCFKGVLAADQLPRKLLAGLYVVNTDPIAKPGEHWVVFYRSPGGSVEFFDSYGHEPTYFHRNWRGKKYNRKRLQASRSSMCGLYCIYYSIHRCRGISMTKMLNIFNRDYNWNDHYVEHFIKKTL